MSVNFRGIKALRTLFIVKSGLRFTDIEYSLKLGVYGNLLGGVSWAFTQIVQLPELCHFKDLSSKDFAGG